MPLDPYFRDRFAAVADITWDDLYSGDAEKIERAIAFSQAVGDYTAPRLAIHDRAAPGPHGPVPVRVYRSETAAPRSAVLQWMHGGAFKWGDLDMLEAHAVAAEIAARSGIVVLSVDYRLVPAYRYPVPLDDCVAVAEWISGGNHDLDVDPDRLSVGGASAGANLASGLVLRTLDGARADVRAVCLAYPAVHAVIPEPSPEVAALASVLPPLARFTAEAREVIYRDYLGDRYDDPPPYGVPGAADLHGFPPVAIANAEYDDLRPSGERFAAQLRDAGVTVDEWVEPGMAHGYLNSVGAVAGASATIDRFVTHLKRWLRPRG